MDKCQNCERAIGNLETPFVFHDQIVCSTCYRFLIERADSILANETAPVEYEEPVEELIAEEPSVVDQPDPYADLGAYVSSDSFRKKNLRRSKLLNAPKLIKNPIGKSAIAMGICSLIVIFIPHAGFVAMIAIGFGLLLTIVGLIAGATTQNGTFATPIIGGIACIIALLIFYQMNGGISDPVEKSYERLINNIGSSEPQAVAETKQDARKTVPDPKQITPDKPALSGKPKK